MRNVEIYHFLFIFIFISDSLSITEKSKQNSKNYIYIIKETRTKKQHLKKIYKISITNKLMRCNFHNMIN